MSVELEKCPNCDYENPAGAKICIRCGAPLTALYWASITTQHTEPPIVEYKKDQVLTIDLPPNTVAFLIEGQPEPKLVENVDKILLGRVETIGDMYLVDFTAYGGQLHGVSRRHAVLRRENNTYVLEDENSTNGTWLNEIRLSPHQPQPLKNGDQVRLGRISFRVYFTPPRTIDEFLYLQKASADRPLTPEDLATLISPFLLAVSEVQKIVNAILGRDLEIVAVKLIEYQDTTIRIQLAGASESIQFVKTKLDATETESDSKTEAAPSDDSERIVKLTLALMSQIAPQMQEQVVNVQFHIQQLRPHLQVLSTSQLRIVPGKRDT